MRKVIFLTSIFVLSCLPFYAQDNSGFGFYIPDKNVPCLTEEQHKAIELELNQSQIRLREKGILPVVSDRSAIVSFAWPLALNNGLDDYGFHGISNFVDQNINFPNQILDYNCGMRTYDQASGYNHGGTDMYLWPFAWYKMQNDQVKIVAAADGIIIYKSDGNFDRNCSFSNDNWNAVYIQHADGSVAWYGHMKNGSLTNKAIGEPVATGEYLGIVGSSGSSTAPHLHFEIHDIGNNLIDPYAGTCNSLNAESWWIDQRPYFDSGLNALRTHSNPPEFPACPETEIPNEKNQFCSNDIIYFAAYYRDQLPDQQLQYKVLRPNNSVFDQWNQTFSVYYSSSWWYWYNTLPAGSPTGTWKFQVTYLDVTYEKNFDVNGLTVITSTGDNTICEGESVTLQAPLGHYGFLYQWKKNGNVIVNGTNSSYIATESGNYTCAVSIPNGCSTNSNSITVNVLSNPMPTITPEGPQMICDGESLDLCANSGAADWFWNIGVNTQCITVFNGGEYIVTVTYANGCSSTSAITVVTVNPSPSVDLGDDIIYLVGEDTVLTAGGDDLTYLWSTGETTSSIIVSEMEIYEVTVTNSFGCTATDQVEVVQTLSTSDQNDSDEIFFYPNPVSETFSISNDLPNSIVISIYNMTGQLIYSQIGTSAIHVSDFPIGVYFVQIRSLAEKIDLAKKVVVIH